MTITSFTNPNKTYQTTFETCTCPDFQYRHHHCKHIKVLRHETNRATHFLLLKMIFDYREREPELARIDDEIQAHIAAEIEAAAKAKHSRSEQARIADIESASLYRQPFSLLR